MELTHSRVSPSGAGRWVNCPGSISMCQQFPESEPSEASREGTATHWIASERLLGRLGVGVCPENGVYTTDEMSEAANEYVNIVRKTVMTRDIFIEHKMPILSVHPDCFGTADTWFFNPFQREIHVFDLKYGYGLVEAFENWQMICYASGAIDHLRLDGLTDQNTTVVIHIVQPRAYHPLGIHREWRVTASDLRGYINKLVYAANHQSPPVVSGDWCKYCSARHACPAALHAAMYAIDYTDTTTPCQLSPDALAVELRTLEAAKARIDARLTGLTAQALGLINQGTIIPGYAIDRGTGRKVWTKPASEVFLLGDLMGVDLRKPPEAVTPTQAIKKGILADVIASYSKPGESGMKLVPDNKTMAGMVFGRKG